MLSNINYHLVTTIVMNDVVIKIRKNSVVPLTHYLRHLLYLIRKLKTKARSANTSKSWEVRTKDRYLSIKTLKSKRKSGQVDFNATFSPGLPEVGVGWAHALDPYLGRSVNPFSTRGGRLCPPPTPPHYYSTSQIFRPSYIPVN